MTNRLRVAARSLATLVFCASSGLAHALPVGDPLDDPFSNVIFDFSRGVQIFGSEAWSYDAGSQLLSYVAAPSFEYRAPGQVSPFAGSFMWQAHVDSTGNLLDNGSMALMGDLGSGSVLLASGTLLDIGFQSHGSCTAIGCDLLSFRAIFDNAWLDESVSDLGSRMGLFFEIGFLSDTPSPFTGDFSCGFGADAPCPLFSTSGLTSIRVSEPGTSALAGLCVLMLAGAWRVRRSTLAQQ